jgi:hypothetical protein
MSAFAVRVSSDKQTLILAGEANPPSRADAGRTYTNRSGMGSQLQRVTMLLVQGEYAPSTLAADSGPAKFLAAADRERVLLPSAATVDAPPVSARFVAPYPSASPSASRALSAGAAEYARTQNLSCGGTRSQLIDAYA